MFLRNVDCLLMLAVGWGGKFRIINWPLLGRKSVIRHDGAQW